MMGKNSQTVRDKRTHDAAKLRTASQLCVCVCVRACVRVRACRCLSRCFELGWVVLSGISMLAQWLNASLAILGKLAKSEL